MTVGEMFEAEQIDLNFILQLDDSSGGYWYSVYKFINDNWNAHTDNLSLKQGAWVTRILDDCIEKRIDMQ